MQASQEAIRDKDGGVHLLVRVQPKASRNAIHRGPEGRLRISLCAPPVDGAANKALREFLAKALGLSKRCVSIVAGERSREKLLSLSGVKKGQVEMKLNDFIGDE